MRPEHQEDIITLTPTSKAPPSQTFDLMAHAGIGKGMWGKTAEEVTKYLHALREAKFE